MTIETPQHCGCADCDAAVSPRAYLADLTRYVTQHVRNGGQPMQLPFLTASFHQPFSDLPVSCEASEKQVHQVRLCIEVLRSYLHGAPPLAAQQRGLAADERAYRLAAYQA